MKLLLSTLLFISSVLADKNETHPVKKQPRGTPEMRRKAHIAHGIVISLAAVILFPIGGILLRWFKTSPRATRFHLIFQLLSFVILLWGLGLGAWLAYLENNVSIPSQRRRVITFFPNSRVTGIPPIPPTTRHADCLSLLHDALSRNFLSPTLSIPKCDWASI